MSKWECAFRGPYSGSTVQTEEVAGETQGDSAKRALVIHRT